MRTLIFMSPEAGHLMPTLRLAMSMKRRGDQVCYLTLPSYFGMVSAYGCDVLPLFSDWAAADVRRDASASPGNRLLSADMFRVVAEHAARAGANTTTCVLAEVQRAVEQYRPDLLLIDSVLNMCYKLQAERWKSAERRVALLATSLPHRYFSHRMISEQMPALLILCPEELEIEGYRIQDPRVRYCNPSLPPTGQKESGDEECGHWQKMDPSRAFVYCSFGTQGASYDDIRRVLRVVIQAGKRLSGIPILISSPSISLESLELDEPLAASVEFRSWVPQAEVLRRARLMVSHGGLGGIKEAIAAGVPSLIIPFSHDQPMNGLRVCSRGIGGMIAPFDCHEGLLAEAMQFWLRNDNAVAEVKRLQDVFLRKDEAELALHAMDAC